MKVDFTTPVSIAVVGPHYAGKSTLCRILQTELGFEIIHEKWQNDPFRPEKTEDFFTTPKNFFHSQIWFLLKTGAAMKKAHLRKTQGKNVVLDTFIYSTLIFSQNVLSEKEFTLFSELFDALAPTFPLPDLLIYLTADAEFLYTKRRMKRVEEKTGPSEDEQTPFDWYKKSWNLNESIFGNWDKTKLLKVDVEKINLKENKEDFQEIVRQIEQTLQK